MRAASWLLSAALFGAVACRDDPPAPPSLPAKETGAGPAASPASVPPAPPSSTEDELPTEEDFELEATRGITSKNLEAELDQLERELKGQ
ncbi:MAG TPA: hypothetical protein VIM73_15485 [Polyangiaceae bacterium]